MAGLYVHIPFCRQKCHYCNFYSLATKKFRQEIVDAIIREIRLSKDYLKGEILETIYFGGGTPSLIPPEQTGLIINTAASEFTLSTDAEITIEANPDDITDSWLDEISKTSVNRLSIGIQSFNDIDLKMLNRVHSASDAEQSIVLAKKKGFDNLSIDLIYGIPGQTEEQWIRNLETVTGTKVPHVSAYALTVEPGTALDLFIKKGKYPPVDDYLAASHFDTLVHQLKKSGYDHYEISNFAKPGKHARHNTAYWQGKTYLGTGPSAHSYNGISRRWNVANLKKYLDGVNSGKPDYESERLSKTQRFNEFVMTSVRTMWGINLSDAKRLFGHDLSDYLEKQTRPFIQKGQMIFSNGAFQLTDRGKFFADGIASDLFYEE